jgi:GT2 family glycosyltransferase
MIDIVIVNWNTGLFLKNCVKSILQSRCILVKNIIIVDNNSDDKSIYSIPRNKNIKLIKNKTNVGFGRACNIGAKYSNQKYLLFLNPDTKIYKNTLNLVFQFMEKTKNKEIGICGVKMVKAKQKVEKSCSRFPTGLNLLLKSLGLDLILKKKSMLMREFNHLESRTVDQVIGAFFFIRKKIFKKLKGFDENFFLYMEEVDLSYRCFLLGYNSFYLSKASCFHAGGVSSSKNMNIRLFNNLKSRYLYSKKHFNFADQLLVLVSFFVEYILRSIISLRNKSYKNFKLVNSCFFNLIKVIL